MRTQEEKELKTSTEFWARKGQQVCIHTAPRGAPTLSFYSPAKISVGHEHSV